MLTAAEKLGRMVEWQEGKKAGWQIGVPVRDEMTGEGDEACRVNIFFVLRCFQVLKYSNCITTWITIKGANYPTSFS
jgi:hypothetical protein